MAGLPVVQHHIDACYRLEQSIPQERSDSNSTKYHVAEVLLLGYYGEDELADFLLIATQSYPTLRIRYCFINQISKSANCIVIIRVGLEYFDQPQLNKNINSFK